MRSNRRGDVTPAGGGVTYALRPIAGLRTAGRGRTFSPYLVLLPLPPLCRDVTLLSCSLAEARASAAQTMKKRKRRKSERNKKKNIESPVKQNSNKTENEDSLAAKEKYSKRVKTEEQKSGKSRLRHPTKRSNKYIYIFFRSTI